MKNQSKFVLQLHIKLHIIIIIIIDMIWLIVSHIVHKKSFIVSEIYTVSLVPYT